MFLPSSTILSVPLICEETNPRQFADWEVICPILSRTLGLKTKFKAINQHICFDVETILFQLFWLKNQFLLKFDGFTNSTGKNFISSFWKVLLQTTKHLLRSWELNFCHHFLGCTNETHSCNNHLAWGNYSKIWFNPRQIRAFTSW